MSGKIPISIKLFINPQICSVIIVEHFLITIIGMSLLTLQNWVFRVSRIPGEFLGNSGDFLKSSLHVATLTKIYNIFYCVQTAEELRNMRL